MMNLKRLFAKKEYNLPWTKEWLVACILVFFFIILPGHPKLDIEPFYGICVILLFLLPRNSITELGLGIHLTRKAKITIVCIAGFYIILNIGIFTLFEMAKQFIIENPEEGDLSGFGYYADIPEAYEIGESYYKAIQDKDIITLLWTGRRLFLDAQILAPIFETLFYFGILFPALWKRINYSIALAITLLLFIIVHGPDILAGGIITIVPVAVIMIELYRRTGSLYPAILFHAMHNLTVTVFYLSMAWGVPISPPGG